MNFINEVKLFTDGGSRGNPGPGAIGILLLNAANQEIESSGQCIGHTTNNRAEYTALVSGLKLAAKHTRYNVTCFMDSELVVMQMNSVYRIKNTGLQQLFQEVKDCERFFQNVTYQYLPRENSFMRTVDRLVNKALDGQLATAPLTNPPQ